MAETNKSQMLSEAEIITAINADSLISVSLGAGQPQKNVKMSTLASVVAGLIPDGFNGILQGRVYVEKGGFVSIPMGKGGLIMVNANVLTSVISAAIVGTSGNFSEITSYKTKFGSEESEILSVVSSDKNIVIKNTIGSDTFVLYKYIMINI